MGEEHLPLMAMVPGACWFTCGHNEIIITASDPLKEKQSNHSCFSKLLILFILTGLTVTPEAEFPETQ